MLYEKKRTFGNIPIDLTDAALAVDTPAYVGQSINAVQADAGTLDYEAENQHFPEENTLEVIGWETATSALEGATVKVALLSKSGDEGAEWKEELAFSIAQAEIVKDQLIRRFTVPAQAARHLQLAMTVGGEVFTAGKLLVLVRPL